jgi:hypothetical protein
LRLGLGSGGSDADNRAVAAGKKVLREEEKREERRYAETRFRRSRPKANI